MALYTLVLIINGLGMTTIVGLPNRESCDSAGMAFRLEAKAEKDVRYYCFANPDRSGWRYP